MSGPVRTQDSPPEDRPGLPRSGWARRGLEALFGVLARLEQRVDRRAHDLVKVFLDIFLMALAALWSWTVVQGREVTAANAALFVALALAIRLPLYALLGIWRYSWKQVSPQDVMQLGLSALAAMPFMAALLYLPDYLDRTFLLPDLERPSIVVVTEPVFYALFLGSMRLLVRMYQTAQGDGEARIPVLVVGAGATGAALGYLLEQPGHEHWVAGYLDDEPRSRGRRIRGRPVLGPVNEAGRWAQRTHAQAIVVATPTLGPERLRELLLSLESTGLPIRTVPPMAQVLTRQASLDDLRELRMEDLLPREAIHLDRDAICGYLCGKTVLVTGGGGSIGRQLCRQVIEAGAAHVLVLGRGENSVFEAIAELDELEAGCRITPVICCVRDRNALEGVFATYAPEVVFHAAAHKHVPLMELYPAEAIKNNVIGTLNLVELALQYGTSRFVLVSTDKAVNPVSIMGASKRVAEQIVRAYAEATGVRMGSVRFGNVLGSRGSVVPIMTRQIRRRRQVTITDPEMVRYFMTIPEAVQLILQAGATVTHGETFILKMGHPVRIVDLACDLIRLAGLTPNVDIPLKIIGVRPGEKLQEELFTGAERDWVEAGEHFYTVPGRRLSLEQVLASVEELRQAAECGDREAIVGLLQNMIPDYLPSGAPVSAS